MHLLQLDKIDSTHLFAKRERASFPPNEITCISAEEQSSGIGQRGRHWASPRGVNLYVTFAFRWPEAAPCLAQTLAYSIAAILKESDLQAWLKWPNDLQLRNKKFCGILCEINQPDVILSAGINVNMTPEQCAAIDQPTCSLLLETGHHWDRAELLRDLQTQWEADLARLKYEGFLYFREQLDKILSYRGQEVLCNETRGKVHSLAEDGRLLLQLADGTIQTISSGTLRAM